MDVKTVCPVVYLGVKGNIKVCDFLPGKQEYILNPLFICDFKMFIQ
jgi:hypothetical protein